jgi:hypothetical protein
LQISKPVWWSAAAAGVTGYLLFWPTQYRIPCVFRLCTGLQCPGCGTTRALTALIKGDFVAAFNYNQLIWFIPVFLLSLELVKRTKWSKHLTIAISTIAAVAALGFFLVRNHII